MAYREPTDKDVEVLEDFEMATRRTGCSQSSLLQAISDGQVRLCAADVARLVESKRRKPAIDLGISFPLVDADACAIDPYEPPAGEIERHILARLCPQFDVGDEWVVFEHHYDLILNRLDEILDGCRK